MDKAVYFITADDDFIADNRAKEIFEEISKDVLDDMSKEIIEASASKVEDAVSACLKAKSATETISLFGGKKAVWIRGMDFIGDTRAGKSEDTKEALANLCEFLKNVDPLNAQVVISASPVDRRKAFFKAMQSFAECEDFSAGKDPTATCVNLIQDTAKRNKIKISESASEALASIVAANPRMALQELEKLSVYLNGERQIELADVVDMVPIFGEGSFFDITDSFFSGNLNAALASLRRYFFANKNASARPIITALQRQNSMLIQLRALMEKGAIPKTTAPQPRGAIEDAATQYSEIFSQEKSAYNVFSQNPWYVSNKLAPLAAKANLKKLMDWQMEFVKAFNQLLERGAGSDETVLRDLFARCIVA